MAHLAAEIIPILRQSGIGDVRQELVKVLRRLAGNRFRACGESSDETVCRTFLLLELA